MQLYYKKVGDSGPAVFILHGLLGSSDNWHTIAKQLAENCQVYLIDQRNHGRSPHSDDMDYELLVQDIHDFFIQQNITKASIIGHSMGGKVAMLLALQHPEFIEELIVVDIAPVFYDGGHETILFAMAEAPLSSMKKREDVEKFLQPRIPNFGVRQFILKNLSRNEDGNFTWKCNLNALIEHYRDLMGFSEITTAFSGTTHFIKGEQSAYITPENWSVCRQYFPQAELHTIKYAGHWVHADNPESFWETLKMLILEH